MEALDTDGFLNPRSLGEFLISGLLGQGGSGLVYDATWGPRRVALKVLHPSLVGTEGARSQFFAEAARLQGIQHPAVVKVLAVGSLPDGRPYLAMERLEGEPLASVLARGPLPVPRALALFEELCGAVGALHDQGLVHRDLKPENVFIVGGVHAVLLDFGIAKEVAAPASTTTIDGGVRGTPAYMAPERFFGQPAGVATDLYELAVTLYAMLAGALPWDDLADPEARLSPRPLGEALAAGGDAAISPELDIEVRRALSTRAQNRPPSARAFAEAVRLAAGTAPSAAPAPSETARMAPSGGRSIVQPEDTAQPGPRAPWFAERRTTTDRGRTPLAWAPSEPAPPSAAAPRRRRWPLVAGAAALVLAGAGVAIWRLGGAGAPARVAGDEDVAVAPAPGSIAEGSAAVPDPWAGGPASGRAAAAAAELPLTGDPVSVAAARAELAAAIRHLPADTQVVFAALVGELRGNEQFDQLLGKLAKHARVVGLLDLVPCLQPIVGGSEWAIYASRSLEDGSSGTLMARGRWRRADVEACFGAEAQPLAMTDGRRMLQLPRLGWIDFVDDHTLYLSLREDLAAAQVHELVMRGKGPTEKARTLLAALPAARTLTAVVDGTDVSWPDESLPKGSHLTAWLAVERSGTAVEVAIDARDPKEAQKLVDGVKPTIDDLFKERESRLLGRLEVARDGAVFRLTGRLTSLMMGMIASQVP
jgi:serine/threonine protein kinase